MSDNKEYVRRSESESQSQAIDNRWKFIIPGILIAFLGYQIIQSKQAQTPVPSNPQNLPVQGNPQNPVPGNPQNPDLSALVGSWQAKGSTDKGPFITTFNFQPDGTFQSETVFSSHDDRAAGITRVSGFYKRTGQNSYISSSEKACVEGICQPYIRSNEFIVISSNELSSGGGRYQKIR